jgi:3-hydroxyacyl-[acyl-carrier-protein] dehydratase
MQPPGNGLMSTVRREIRGGKMEKSFRQGLSQLTGTGERMSASAVVSADSAWYVGHFPGNPILPGIAVLALVKEAIITSELREGRRALITGLGRVRFRLPVKPGDLMTLEITREKKRDQMAAYHFSVNLAGEVACTGTFTARLAEGPGEQTS